MTDTIRKAAMALGGGLMVLGTAGLGIVELLAGEPYGAAPLTNEAGAVIATPAVDPVLRTGLVLAGFAVLALDTFSPCVFTTRYARGGGPCTGFRPGWN